MTRINQLPATSLPIAASDLIEGERVNGTSEKWTIAQAVGGYAPIACRLYRTNAHSAAFSYNALPWDTADFNVGGLWAASPNPERLTVPADGAGVYVIHASITYSVNASGNRGIWFSVNGDGNHRLGIAMVPTVSGNDSCIHSGCIVRLAAGDYVICYTYQSAGGNIPLMVAASKYGSPTHIGMARLGS